MRISILFFVVLAFIIDFLRVQFRVFEIKKKKVYLALKWAG